MARPIQLEPPRLLTSGEASMVMDSVRQENQEVEKLLKRKKELILREEEEEESNIRRKSSVRLIV